METLLQDIPAVMIYILITGKSEEHLETLERVLACLEESGLKLKRSKRSLMAPSVTYLGQKIDKDGIHPLAEQYKRRQSPRMSLNLKRTSDYGKFMPNLAHTTAPLYCLLCAAMDIPRAECF